MNEIIIVDTGSSDSTKEIARQYTNDVYDFTWIEDFAAARNYSFSKATKDYVMWLDADDVILEKDQILLKSLKNTLDPSVDMIMMKYNTAFDEDNQPIFSYYRERLMKRKSDFQWLGAIHEVIPQKGNVIHSEIAVTHQKICQNDSGRNLRIFENMIKKGIVLEPRMQFYYGRELIYHGNYEKAIQILETFLTSEDGWIENKINACQDLYLCYQEINNEDKAIRSLFHSFKFDIPRAEICCDIGKYLMNQAQYETAAYWYQVAASRKPDLTSGGFYSIDCYDYIPYMQLCVCYDKIKNYKEAYRYHIKAKHCKPNNNGVLWNEKYFEGLKDKI